jgi:predicted GTPase
VVFNKCDGLYDEGDVINEASRLALGPVHAVSSFDGSGVIDLLNFINDCIPLEMKQ